MKYFFDTEFIENGKTIDLISIGMVSEDGSRSLYAQNAECNFQLASDWVWRNVFLHLGHFDMQGKRTCQPRHETYDSGLGHRYSTQCCTDTAGHCPWATRQEIKESILDFCDVEKHGKPEFWGYYADYDWVVFCQLFGTMMDLPKGFPMYCRDLKQLLDSMGNPKFQRQDNVHSAMADALWVRETFLSLTSSPVLQSVKAL